MVAQPTLFVAPVIDALGEANLVGITSLVGELRRVLQQQDRALAGVIPCASGGEVPAQDVGFLHFRVREEPVGGLRVRPNLARKWDGSSHSVTELLQQIGEPAAKPGVFESRLIGLLVTPMRRTIVPSRHLAPHQTNQVLDTESQGIHSIQHSCLQVLYLSQ